MTRPKITRLTKCKPCCGCFKPQGIDCSCQEETLLLRDEFEAIKLHDADGLDQMEAAESMEISQSTFARILKEAHRKVSKALVEGKVIKIED